MKGGEGGEMFGSGVRPDDKHGKGRRGEDWALGIWLDSPHLFGVFMAMPRHCHGTRRGKTVAIPWHAPRDTRHDAAITRHPQRCPLMGGGGRTHCTAFINSHAL